MANEIKLTFSSIISNSEFSDRFQPGTMKFDQAAQGMQSQVVSVTTDAAVISNSNIGTLGWLIMQNLDDTNYVTWGSQATSGALFALGRLEPTEWAAFRLQPGTTLMAQADTTTCKVLFKFYED